MRRQRISDHEASAVLRGQTPEARQDLGFLADSVTMFRVAVHGVSPQPSAEVAHRLDLERVASISTSANGLPSQTVTNLSPSKARKAKVLVSGFVGLGLAAKIALGATAATAVGITGAGVAGAAGVLPPAVQQQFDRITGQDIHSIANDIDVDVDGDDGATVEHPGNNASETGTENSEFGQETAEDARLKGEQPLVDETPGQNGREIADEQRGESQEANEEAAENAGTKGPASGDLGERED